MPLFRTFAILLVSALCGLSGCVNTPLHNEYVDPTDGTVRFDGVAHGPTRRIDVQARRKDTGQWVTIGVTASRSSPYTTGSGDRGYYYGMEIDIDGIGPWKCFYQASCSLRNGTNWAQFRVLEQGNALITLTRPEAQCISDKLFNQGVGALQAYQTCGGTYRRSLNLYWYRPYTFPGDLPGKLNL